MADEIYNKGREAFLGGEISWLSSTICIALVSAGYVFNAAHQSLVDLGSHIVAISSPLGNKTITDGIADADNVVFTEVFGPRVTQLVICLNTGTASTSTLLVYIDSAPELPIDPNGGEVFINFDDGANKIFRL